MKSNWGNIVTLSLLEVTEVKLISPHRFNKLLSKQVMRK